MIGIYKTFESLSHNVRPPLNLSEGYDPSIINFSCCWPKVWIKGSKDLFSEENVCLRYRKEFYYYSKKTNYFSEIYNTLYK
jgi:hypothetical protein